MIELNNLKSNSVIVIAGPTASGKSGMALDVALNYNGVVINADSMQVYEGTPIISAVPSAEDKARVEHRLYEIYPPSFHGTVVEWLESAVAEIQSIWREDRLPIVVGGTGLYIDNLINGTTPIPVVSIDIRQKVQADFVQFGVVEMHRRLADIDAEAAAKLNPNDTTRVRRAWEIFLQTGKTLSAWYKVPMVKKLPEAEFKVIKIIPTAEELDERCYFRFDKMIDAGALEEVRSLASLNLDKNLPAMKMLGVPELLAFIEGKVCLSEAVEQAKLHTRQYAKRQRTWFRHKLRAETVLDHCY